MTTTAAPPRGPAETRPSLGDQLARQRAVRRRLRRAALAVLGAALVVTAVWLVYVSAVLGTRDVVVRGTHDLTADQVRQAAAVPLGTPLARQDLDAVARRATSLPAVSAARVTRSWPHTVQVVVTERVPLLGVAQPGGFLVVDADGVGFASRSALPAGVVRAEVPATDRDLLVRLGTVVQALPADVRDQVSSVSASTPDSIVLRLRSGVQVRWGDAESSPLKASVATALLARHPRHTIDVSSPHNPAVR